MMRLFSSRRQSITADVRARAARFEQQYGRLPSQRELARLAQVTRVPDDLDDLSGIPRYLQVARVIEAEIKAGQWTPGNPVPSRNQLAERFGIARETAARAHAWLARVGYLVAVPGVGMVVTPANRWPGRGI